MQPLLAPLTLEQLVRQSDTIVVVDRDEPFKSVDEKEVDDCMTERWPLTVTSVLRGPAKQVRAGQRLNVIVATTYMISCGEGKKTLSLPHEAQRYSGADPAYATAPPRRFVVFLKTTPRGPQLSAVGAFETEARIADIVRLIKP